jgi:hypothetical protein
MAKIRYTGTAGTRSLGGCEWNQANGYICEVTDPAVLEDVLTYPKPEFELVEEGSKTPTQSQTPPPAPPLQAGRGEAEGVAKADGKSVMSKFNQLRAASPKKTKRGE